MRFLLIGLLAISACAENSEKVNIITKTEVAPIVNPPNCPDWTGTDWKSRNESNFGCASRNNMGQMVAEPMDMVAGRGTNYYDGKKTAAAVSAYRGGDGAAASSGASSATTAASGQ